MPRLTVLIVAHQGPLQMALVDSLQQVGCRVGTASNEDLGVEQASEIRPDVVLLEHPLPDGDSLEACRRIRDVFSAQEQPVFLMTPTEFRLLWILATQPGHVLSRRLLSGACRGAGAHIQQRTIDVHVKSIRQKLKGHANMIETVRGLGYRLRESQKA